MRRHASTWWVGAWVFVSAAVLGTACAGRSVQHEREGVSDGGFGADSNGARGSTGANGGTSAKGGTGANGGTSAEGGTGANGGAGAKGGTGANGGTGAKGGTGANGGAGGMTGASGGVTGRAGGTGGGAAGAGASAGGGGAAESECLLAVRVDECCAPPSPVARAEYDADPCWAAWDPSDRALRVRRGCAPVSCPTTCGRADPETRVAALAPSGRCDFASECEEADDCTLLWDAHECCTCAVYPLPGSFAGQDCWVEEGESPPSGCNACSPTGCNCPAVAPPSCVRTPGGLGRCVSATSDLAEGQCAAEQACSTGNAGVPCPVCVAPGDKACGGPAPPPATCATDSDCNVAATNLICEAAPCQNLACIQGCIADSDCAPSELCAADHRCAPASCMSDAECNANRRCEAGRCVRRACTVSSDCGDYCVNNTCYERPGACADGCIP